MNACSARRGIGHPSGTLPTAGKLTPYLSRHPDLLIEFLVTPDGLSNAVMVAAEKITSKSELILS